MKTDSKLAAATINRAWGDILRHLESVSSRLADAWAEATDIAAQQEADHRKLGTRMLGRAPKRKVNIMTAARMLVVREYAKVVLDPIATVTADDVINVRRDLILARSVAVALRNYTKNKFNHGSIAGLIGHDVKWLSELDYTTVVAEKE